MTHFISNIFLFTYIYSRFFIFAVFLKSLFTVQSLKVFCHSRTFLFYISISYNPESEEIFYYLQPNVVDGPQALKGEDFALVV